MKTKLVQLVASTMLLALMVAPAFADTLLLKSGEQVTGYFEGGTVRTVRFRGSDGLIKDYDILSIQQLQFGDEPKASSSIAPPPAAEPVNPTLHAPADRPPAQPPSNNAANTGYTLPTGSKISIRMVDSINSETQKVGAPFVAVLDQPLMVDGVEVAPKGTDVRGRVSNVNEAGRVTGAAQLGLELTQVIVNGIPYSVTTSEYNEVAESRTGQTVKRGALGAGAGAIIGAVIGGGKGAAVGAGVGGGGVVAAQAVTKGEKLNIPAETRLEFTLRTPLVIAGM
jgi:hypothetical protein